MPAPPPTPDFRAEVVVRNLVSDLASMKRRVVLVIDDAHELADPEILDGLRYLLEHLPSTIHVVLITRHDLHVGLHRHQLEGGVTEIRSAQLRFSLDETRRMFEASGVELSPETLGLLHERTEGWVAGLRLAAISLATHPENPTGSWRRSPAAIGRLPNTCWRRCSIISRPMSDSCSFTARC